MSGPGWYSFGRATHGELGRLTHTGPEASCQALGSDSWFQVDPLEPNRVPLMAIAQVSESRCLPKLKACCSTSGNLGS
eukprot:s2808_g5.t2